MKTWKRKTERNQNKEISRFLMRLVGRILIQNSRKVKRRKREAKVISLATGEVWKDLTSWK